MPATYDYDLVVIGSGPAGEKGAVQAAYFGKRVALVERAPHLGGAGINTGTLPSKTLRETALYFSGLRQRGLYGIDYSLRENLTGGLLMHRALAVVQHQRQTVQRNLDRHRIEVVRGEARLADAHTVRVRLQTGGQRDLTTGIVLIATGSSPHHPADVPFDRKIIHDSDSILHTDRIPKTMVVVGGGVIGSKYASIFAALGVHVTLVDSRSRPLPVVDHEIASRLQQQLERLGVRFVFNDRVARVGGAFCVKATHGRQAGMGRVDHGNAELTSTRPAVCCLGVGSAFESNHGHRVRSTRGSGKDPDAS